MTGINKVLVRIANGKDPDDQTAGLGLHCLSRPFWHTTKEDPE